MKPLKDNTIPQAFALSEISVLHDIFVTILKYLFSCHGLLHGNRSYPARSHGRAVTCDLHRWLGT